MIFRHKGGLLCSSAAALLLTGCGMMSASEPPPAVVSSAPTVEVGGIQQLPVSQNGRLALRNRLLTLTGAAPGTLTDARISNAWRTAASARVTPNDYAACVGATTPAGSYTYMVVVAGGATGDVKSGQAALKICSDPSRVTSWEVFSEAMAPQ